MSWLSNLMSSGIENVVSSVGDAIDKNVTSDEEKLILKNQLKEIELRAGLESENQYLKHEAEITERWKSDNEHAVTRLVRPISYGAMLVLFVIIVGFDGNVGEFKVNKEYIPVLQGLLTTMTIAYFGSRGLEKITKNMKKQD